MAERSNTEKNHKAAAQDVSTLQKRARRRLVGAIALVLLAVIVLPMIFDPEPRQSAPTVNIRIPNEEAGKFAPKATPKPPAPQAEATVPAQPAALAAAATPVAPVAAPEAPGKEGRTEPKPEPKSAAKVAEKPVAKAAAAAAAAPAPTGEQFVVQVGAFASPEKVKERTDQLRQAKLPFYTETIATANGTVTRIRVGPYPSKEAAEKARDRAKALGMAPANPVAR